MGLIKAVCKKGLYIESGQARFFGPTNEAIELYNKALNEKRKNATQESHDEQGLNIGIVDITNVRVTDLESGAENELLTSQPARFNIQYHAYESIPDASIVVRVIRSDGLFCCTLYSRIDQFPIPLSQGDGLVTVDLCPVQLYPGTYYAVITLKNQNETLTLDKVYSDWFEVRGELSGYEDMDAVFEPNRKWDLQHLEESPVRVNRHGEKHPENWD
jgi:hypothetical protein